MRKRTTLDTTLSIISICLIIQLLISQKVWLVADRAFPVVPAFENFTFSFLYELDFLFFGLVLFVLLLMALFPWRTIFQYIFLFLGAIAILQDLTRLQVWFYLFYMLIALLAFGTEKNKTAQFSALQLVIIAVYFWGGFHKLNVYFIEDVFPDMMQYAGVFSGLGNYKIASVFAALFEMGIGIGLFFLNYRKWAVYMACLFHLIILYLLGPFGENWNEVVWPWNFTMIGLLFLLFYNSKNTIFEDFYQKVKIYPLSAYIIFLFLIMPFFNSFGLWGEQLSMKMYAGTNPEGVLYVDYKQRGCFPKAAQKLVYGVNTQRLVIDDWSFSDLKVAPFSADSRLKQIAFPFCTCLKNPKNGGLEILKVSRFSKTNDTVVKISCDQLLKENIRK